MKVEGRIIQVEGRIIRLKSGSSVTMTKMPGGVFRFNMTTPIPPLAQNMPREEILTNHRVAKCNLDGNDMVTTFSLSPEALYALLCLAGEHKEEIEEINPDEVFEYNK